MTDDEAEALWQTLRDVSAIVGQAQAFNRAYSYILMEIVRDLARQSTDPQKYSLECLSASALGRTADQLKAKRIQ